MPTYTAAQTVTHAFPQNSWRVLSIDQLVDRILRSGTSDVRRLDGTQRELALRGLLVSGLRRDLGTIPGNSPDDILARAMSTAIGELELAACSPAKLAGTGVPRLKDVSLVYNSYQQYLRTSGSFDLEERFLMAAEVIRREKPAVLKGVESIYAFGFFDATPVQQWFFEALRGAVQTLLNGDCRSERIDAVVKTLPAETELLSIQDAANAVFRLLTAGSSPDDVMFVAGRPDQAGAPLRTAMKSLGIPCGFAVRATLSTSPYVQAVLKLTGAVASIALGQEYSLPELLTDDFLQNLLPSGVFLRDMFINDHRPKHHDTWREQVSHLASVNGNPEPDGEEGVYPDRGTRQRENALAELVQELDALSEIARKIPREGSLMAYVEWQVALVAQSRISPLAHDAEAGEVPDDLLPYLARDHRAFTSLIASLHNLADLPVLGQSGFGLSLMDWGSLLTELASSTQYVAEPAEPGGVRLLSVSDARALSVDHVFVLGAVDGSLPRRAEPDWFMADYLRERFWDALRLDTRERRQQHEEELFGVLKALASRQICFCYGVVGITGQRQLVSPYLTQILGDSTEHPELTTRRDGYRPARSECVSPDSLRRACLAEVVNGEEPCRKGMGVFSADEWNWLCRRRIGEAAREHALLPDWSGNLTSTRAGELIRTARRGGFALSTGQFERLFGCPFRHFLEHELGVREAENLEDRYSRLDLGNAMHLLMNEVFAPYRGEFPDLDSLTAGLEDRLKRLLGELRPDVSPLIARLQVKMLAQRITNFWREAEGLRNVKGVASQEPRRIEALEWSFGMRLYPGVDPASTEEGLTLQTSSGARVTLRGRIDRIDSLPQRNGELVVMDYKIGKVGVYHPDEDLPLGKHIQALVYRQAVERLFPRHAAVHAALYLGVGDCACSGSEVRGALLTGHLTRDKKARVVVDDWSGWNDLLKRLAERACEHEAKGSFLPSPSDRDECQSFGRACPYRVICRYPQVGGDEE
jgi:hypothetical protein